MSIFSDNAPAYFARGMSVIPLDVKSKKPTPTAWADYASSPIPLQTQEEWMRLPRNHNIGMVTGQQSGVVVIDIDTVDPIINAAILGCLPHSPWERIGKKGCVLAFKFNPAVVSFKIKSKELGMLCEHLAQNADGQGNQVVLPPSIHPDTNRPYVANAFLPDVLDQLVMLPDDIELRIRRAIEAAGVDIDTKGVGSLADHISAGFRDSSITERAGVISHEIVRGKISMKKGIELLYGIEANFTQQVSGDAMDMDKHVRNLIKFVKKDLVSRNQALPNGWDEGMTPEQIEKLNMGDTITEWTYEQILDYFKETIDNERDPLKVIKFAIQKMSQMGNPDVLRETNVINQMALAGTTDTFKITPADIKKELAKVRVELNTVVKVEDGTVEMSLTTHTEIALATIKFMEDDEATIRAEHGILYRWMGSHWEAMDAAQVKYYIATKFTGVELMKRNSDIDGVYKQVLILVPQGLRTDARSYVNVANGMLLETGSFVEHHPDFGANYVLPYRYLPDSREMSVKMPHFHGFLSECWGHREDFADTMKAFQEALCATFMGYATKFQKVFLLIGLARSGKSVLLDIISSLFPDQAKAAVSFSKLQDGQMMVSLDKKLINIVGELSEKQYIAGDLFKSLADGSSVSVRRLYADAYGMRPICANWAASNHLPKTHDTSEGFIRRWLMFVFDKQVAEDKVDINLASRIISSEREQIFAWAIEALPRLLQQGRYTLPVSHKQKLSTLACQTNPVLFYLSRDHNLKFGDGLEATETDLYFQFRNFYRVSIGSKKSIDMSEFKSMMLECLHGRQLEIFMKDRDLNTYYRGISVDLGMKM